MNIDDAVAVNAIRLIAKVDSITIDACTDGAWQAQVLHGSMESEWIIGDTPEEAIVIACSRALEEVDPSPYCQYCRSMTKAGCECGPIAGNH